MSNNSNNPNMKYATFLPGLPSGTWRAIYIGPPDAMQRLPGSLDGNDLPTVDQLVAHMAAEGYAPARALPSADTPRDAKGYLVPFRKQGRSEAETLVDMAKASKSADKPDTAVQAVLKAHLRSRF